MPAGAHGQLDRAGAQLADLLRHSSDTGFTYVLSALTGGAFNQVFLPPGEQAALNANPTANAAAYQDAHAIAMQTNATGSSFVTSNSAGTRTSCIETNMVQSGNDSGGQHPGRYARPEPAAEHHRPSPELDRTALMAHERGTMDFRAARFSRGMTLIELMMVVVIATILMSIAVPSYMSQVRQSRRIEAKTALLDLAGREERFFSTS